MISYDLLMLLMLLGNAALFEQALWLSHAWLIGFVFQHLRVFPWAGEIALSNTIVR